MIGIQPRAGNHSRCIDGCTARLAPVNDCRKSPMSRFSSLPERALEMAMQVVPQGASKMLQTGVALGALKTGTRVAGSIIRRNPAMAAAAAAGAGVLWYLARRHAKRAENGPINSTSTRVDARRAGAKSGNGQSRAQARKTTSRARKATTPSQ